MVYTSDFSNVIDVVDQSFERRTGNLGHPLSFDAVNCNVVDRFAFCF